MTIHNLDDEHHPLKPFYNAKDHVEQIVALPEFEKLHESYKDEPAPFFFGDKAALKKSRRIYRFLELAHPYLQPDEDAEAYLEEQQTSSKLRKFLDSVSDSVRNTGSAVIIKHTADPSVVKTVTVKESALKKTIQQLENRISQIRRQLGE